MDINNIKTLEQFKLYLSNGDTFETSINDIILRNGWIDERYMDNGICRVGNQRLEYNVDLKPVIRTIELTGLTRSNKGINRKKIMLSLDPEFYTAIDGVANKSRFISDAILFYRGNVNSYSKKILRIPSNPDYRFITIKISQQAQDILNNVASKHQYMRDAVMAYQEYKQQYI